jgi:WD40 repeat protein
MSRMSWRVALTGLLLASVGAAERPPRVDRFGDPLPAEALARMGSVRFRQGATVGALAFSPDGKTVVSQGWGGNGVCVWDAATGREVRRFGRDRDRPFRPGCLSPDGRLAALPGDGPVEFIGLWDVARGQLAWQLGQRRYRSARFAPDSKLLAAFAIDGAIELWNAPAGELVRSWAGHQGGATHGLFTPDGKTLVSAGAGGKVRLWEVATGKQRAEWEAAPHLDVAMAVSPDGKLLAFVGEAEGQPRPAPPDSRIRLWDLGAGKEVRRLEAPKPDALHALAFDPDGSVLVSGGDRGLYGWEPAAGKMLWQSPRLAAPCLTLAFSPDGKTLAAADGGVVRLFDPASGKERVPLRGPATWVFAAALSADGKTLATAGQGGVIHLWEPATGKEVGALAGHESTVLALALSPDGRALYSAGADRTLRVWDLSARKEVHCVRGIDASRLDALALSPDGKTLAVPGAEGTVLLLEPATGKQVRVLPGSERPVNGLSFAGTGTLVGWTRDQAVCLWRTATGEKVRQFTAGEPRERPLPAGGTGFPSYAATVSPDGRLVAVGLPERILLLLDAATGREVRRLTDLPDGVSSVRFAPDGRTLAWGGGDDPAVRLVEVLTGGQRHAFTGHQGRVVALAFSADGKTLVSGSADTTALVWDLTGRLAAGERWNKPPTRGDLDACWDDLGGEDAARADRAIRRLAAAPDQAVPYLRERVRPVATAEEGRLARLIADLDSDRFEVRRQAAVELEKLGDAAAEACRKALDGQPSAEARRVLQAFLEKQDREEWAPPPERLRALRALEALEGAGTAPARQALVELARGAPGARLTREARAALDRLARRPAAP